MRRFTLLIILNFLVGLTLAACGGSATPALIGAYRSGDSPPIATYSAPPNGWQVVYTANLELAVSDPGEALTTAYRLAEFHGGYATRLETGFVGADLNAWASLVVPLAEYSGMRADLLLMGTLAGETSSSQLAPPGGAPAGSVTFEVHFVEAAQSIGLPAPASSEPHLYRTFRSALSVAVALFTYLADIAIWFVVVAGPFVLLGLGLRRLFRQLRRATPSEEKKE